MNFYGAARPLTVAGIEAARDRLRVTDRHIWAILKVETNGFGFLEDRRPAILYERHIFARLTEGRFTGKAPASISHPEAGGYIGGAREYDRLAKAMALDETAALKSASWGLPQLMGLNHAKAGYSTPQAMVQAFCAAEDAQLAGMAAFIASDPAMAAALRANDWAGFARRYNGLAYAKNRYDEKLAAAFRAAGPDLGMRTAQAGLTFLGFGPGPVDGLPGARTKGAIAAFQTAVSLPATGILDDVTARLIADRAWPPAPPKPVERPMGFMGWFPRLF